MNPIFQITPYYLPAKHEINKDFDLEGFQDHMSRLAAICQSELNDDAILSLAHNELSRLSREATRKGIPFVNDEYECKIEQWDARIAAALDLVEHKATSASEELAMSSALEYEHSAYDAPSPMDYVRFKRIPKLRFPIESRSQ